MAFERVEAWGGESMSERTVVKLTINITEVGKEPQDFDCLMERLCPSAMEEPGTKEHRSIVPIPLMEVG